MTDSYWTGGPRPGLLFRSRRFQSLPGDVLHVHLLDLSVELERRLLPIIERYRRARRCPDIETIISREKQCGTHRNPPPGHPFPVRLIVLSSGPPGRDMA